MNIKINSMNMNFIRKIGNKIINKFRLVLILFITDMSNFILHSRRKFKCALPTMTFRLLSLRQIRNVSVPKWYQNG